MLLHVLLFLVIKSGVMAPQRMEVFVPVNLIEEADALTLPVSGENPPADIEEPAPPEPAVVEETPGKGSETEQAQPVIQPRPIPRKVEASGSPKATDKHPGGVRASAKGTGEGTKVPSDSPGVGSTQGHREGPGEGDTGSPVAVGPSRWPSISKGLQNQGVVKAKVVLKVLVSKEGAPVQVELQDGSGYDELDSRALKEIRNRWQFKPRLKDGHPVEDWITVTVKFGDSD